MNFRINIQEDIIRHIFNNQPNKPNNLNWNQLRFLALVSEMTPTQTKTEYLNTLMNMLVLVNRQKSEAQLNRKGQYLYILHLDIRLQQVFDICKHAEIIFC